MSELFINQEIQQVERLISQKGVGATEDIALKLAELRVENMEAQRSMESLQKNLDQARMVNDELRFLVGKQFS